MNNLQADLAALMQDPSFQKAKAMITQVSDQITEVAVASPHGLAEEVQKPISADNSIHVG